jgi:tryptophan 2,3-dioxygenase
MNRDYSVPILEGSGDTDYARYMRTNELLSLQRKSEEVSHRDELLFQVVHQSTELWLKHACFEVEEASHQVQSGGLEAAIRLLRRGTLGIELITGQLEMLRHLAPWDFQTLRTVLGHGSGFESPGWRAVQRVSHALGTAFDELIAREQVDLIKLYKGSPDCQLYRLAEAMLDWDERVAIWRVRHYKIATRIIGHGVVGTKGTPVDVLTRLIGHKFFPALWRVRTELTETGPMADMSQIDQPRPQSESDQIDRNAA